MNPVGADVRTRAWIIDMKFIYLGMCALAIAATWKFSSEMSHALASTKDSSQEAIARFSASEGADVTPEPPAAVKTPVPEQPVGQQSDAEATETVDEAIAEEIVDSEVTAEKPVPQIFRKPITRHEAPLHDTMITPGNFTYLGAFRPPHHQARETSFAYGGWALAYRPDGDASGTDDGYPGSLYIVGHASQQMVAEISIPEPVNLAIRHADHLPVAKVVQDFQDVSDGILGQMTAGSSEPFMIGGMCVSNNQLHWTTYKFYNVENLDYPSHGRSGLQLQSSIAEGLWHLGPLGSSSPEWNSYKNAGYVLEIPESERHWFGGHSLVSGLQISTGLQASSQGPALYSYAPPEAGYLPNKSLSATPLAWYSMNDPLERHHPADRWSGAAWLTLGNKQAVIVVGRKSLGEFYYGEPRPGDCSEDKGYHGAPYEVEIAFYSPASLIHAANGKLPAMGLRPWLRWGGTSPGGGVKQYFFDTCHQYTGGVAYDRERNILYVAQVDAAKTSDNEWDVLPVIHAFRISE